MYRWRQTVRQRQPHDELDRRRIAIYSLTFRGEFETENQEAWKSACSTRAKGVLQTDVDRINFVNPGAGVTNEHPIPAGWQA